MTIEEFLLARIAEDEDRASLVMVSEVYIHGGGLGRLDRRQGSGGVPEVRYRAIRSRVLAECEAKRRIVETAAGWKHVTVEDCWYSCAATSGMDVENACCNDGAGTDCDCGLDYRVGRILNPLAAIYADHPDYDEAWATLAANP